ncbi:hypothetical protein DPX39_100076900 [Trypanosoma brucei equiperdum]|uniref:Uncharacterized protein n=1 Tax=Trypanosoma brucei equiperdum TaxID=630700 RepID=A0A3L6KYJ4_9TRYP|nr:hypothetical protein DPX39_100076900 [Trypanosoma brucei equiperdum]
MRRFARRLHTPLILRKTRDTPVTPLRFCSASTNNATSEVALNHGRNPLDLVDVLGGGERPPLERNCEATGAANLSKVTLRQIVRDVRQLQAHTITPITALETTKMILALAVAAD